MFNRRFIREKVLQSLYAFYQGDMENGRVCEKNMLFHLQQIYELYIYHLACLNALADYFHERAELARKQFIPMPDALTPVDLSQNEVIRQIAACPRFTLPNEAFKFNWSQQESLFKTLYDEVLAASFYQEYVSAPRSFENDRTFLQKLYKKKVVPNAVFRSLCDDRSIIWAADYDSVAYWVYTSIKKAEAGDDSWIPDNFARTGEDESAEITFGKQLLEKTLLHGSEYESLIVEQTENWEADRIAVMELIILKTAVAEFVNFPSIPLKVTLNEYIEISKRFCSEKSRIFVNGLLHKLSAELQSRHMIKKTGRGLI